MHFRRLFALMVTALLGATFLHAQVAGRLSGVVVDQTGAAVPGAAVNVYLTGGKEPLLKGQTNESGQFSFVTVGRIRMTCRWNRRDSPESWFER